MSPTPSEETVFKGWTTSWSTASYSDVNGSRPRWWCVRCRPPRDLWVWTLCGDGGQGYLLGVCGLGGGGAALGEDVEADVAAGLGPFVVLLGEDRADEADQGVAVGEDADDVGAAADLPVEPLVGIVGPDLPPDRLREGGEGEDVRASRVEVGRDGRKLVG